MLAEPLGEEDNLYAANINVKPIGGVLLKVETVTDENDRSSRKRTTRKSAAAAAAAIRVKSEHSPDSDIDIPRTTRSKRYSKSSTQNNEVSRKKIKPIKIKAEYESDNENARNNNEIDIKQCRICLSKDTLISLFKKDHSYTAAEKIMNICHTIKIIQKDNLPQYICYNCVQSVNVAFNLKILCEKTDKELRNKLKRKKYKKIKKEPDDGEESVNEGGGNIKDDDFVVSNESAHSAAESDSDSDFGSKRKRSLRKKKTSGLKKRGKTGTNSGGGGGGGGGGASSGGKRNRPNKEKLENGKADDGNCTTDDDNSGPSKKKRAKLKSSKTDDDEKKKEREHICLYCEEKFPTRNTLREHKKSHAGQKPFTCDLCNKQFKMIGSYNAHLQKHKEEENLMCTQCDNKQFSNKTEFKKHMSEIHNDPPATFICDKCKRGFTTQARLDKHKDGKCPGHELPPGSRRDKKKNSELDAIAIGKDLFKCVAPLTTTYWSDSFSD